MSTKKTTKWMPKIGEKFWYIFVDSSASFDQTQRNSEEITFCRNQIRIGNFFKTRDEAKAVAKKINNMFRSNR